MEDKNSGKIKRALKGIHSGTNIAYEDFVDVLYNNTKVLRTQTCLRRDSRKFTVNMQTEKKRALNSIYYKLKVSDNFVSCSPHTDENGEYM